MVLPEGQWDPGGELLLVGCLGDFSEWEMLLVNLGAFRSVMALWLSPVLLLWSGQC